MPSRYPRQNEPARGGSKRQSGDCPAVASARGQRRCGNAPAGCRDPAADDEHHPEWSAVEFRSNSPA